MIADILEWISKAGLVEANAAGKGDCILRYYEVPDDLYTDPTAYAGLVYKFKNPDHAMMFKLTWA